MALHHNPRIVTQGLEILLDPADINSYPGSGTAWTNLVGDGTTDAVLNGGISFVDDNQGALYHDGSDDYVRIYGYTSDSYDNGEFTWITWIRPDSQAKFTFVVKARRPNIIRGENQLAFYAEFEGANGYQQIGGNLSNSRNTYGRWFCLALRVTVSGAITFDVFDPTNDIQQTFTGAREMPGASGHTDPLYLNVPGWWGGGRDENLLGLQGPFLQYGRAITDEELVQNYETYKTRLTA